MPNDGDHFAKLLAAHDRELRLYISSLLPRRNDVEEVMQQTAVVLWEKFDAYDANRDFLPWATRFAYFEVLNFRKLCARSRLIYTEEVMQVLAESRNDVSEELQLRRSALQNCLSQLDEDARSLLDCRYGSSSTMKYFAEESGRTMKSLYRRLDRIREVVAMCIDRQMSSLRDEI